MATVSTPLAPPETSGIPGPSTQPGALHDEHPAASDGQGSDGFQLVLLERRVPTTGQLPQQHGRPAGQLVHGRTVPTVCDSSVGDGALARNDRMVLTPTSTLATN